MAARKPNPISPSHRVMVAINACHAEVSRALAEAESFDPGALTLGEMIKKHRGELSLQDVATRAGLSKQHVWEIEAGRSINPTVAVLTGLATALGLSAVALFRAAMRTQQT